MIRPQHIRRCLDAVSLVPRRQGHTNAIRALALSRDGQTLFSGSRDNTIRVWRTRDGMQMRVIEGHSSYVQALALNRDSSLLYSACHDGHIRCWRTADLSTMGHFEGHTMAVRNGGRSPPFLTLSLPPSLGRLR